MGQGQLTDPKYKAHFLGQNYAKVSGSPGAELNYEFSIS